MNGHDLLAPKRRSFYACQRTPARYEMLPNEPTEDAGDPYRALAEHYVAFWNDLERAGLEPSDTGIWKVSSELSGGSWVIYHDDQDGQWKITDVDDAPKVVRHGREAQPQRYGAGSLFVYRCPFCGGVAYGGDPTAGGVFHGNVLCSRCGRGFSILGRTPERSLYSYARQIRYAMDASGHEHKGKGEGGGQFTSSDGAKSNTSREKPKPGERAKAAQGEYEKLIAQAKAAREQARAARLTAFDDVKADAEHADAQANDLGGAIYELIGEIESGHGDSEYQDACDALSEANGYEEGDSAPDRYSQLKDIEAAAKKLLAVEPVVATDKTAKQREWLNSAAETQQRLTMQVGQVERSLRAVQQNMADAFRRGGDEEVQRVGIAEDIERVNKYYGENGYPLQLAWDGPNVVIDDSRMADAIKDANAALGPNNPHKIEFKNAQIQLQTDESELPKGLSPEVIAENKRRLHAIVSNAKEARQHLKVYVQHRKEMQSIKTGKPMSYAALVGILRYAAKRIPKGYIVNKDGRVFRAGMWVNEQDLALAVPATSNKTPAQHGPAAEASKQAAYHHDKRRARGDVNREQLSQKTAPHAQQVMGKKETTHAKQTFAGLHQHHGDLTGHRIEELINGAHEALQHVHPDDQVTRDRLSKRLRAYHEMLNWHDAKMKAQGSQQPAATPEATATPEPQPTLAPAPAAPAEKPAKVQHSTLRAIVKDWGGINIGSLEAHGFNVKDLREDGLGGLFRAKGGIDITELAEMLHNEGHIQIPGVEYHDDPSFRQGSRTLPQEAPQYLLDQLKNKVKSLYANSDSEYAASYAAHQKGKEYAREQEISAGDIGRAEEIGREAAESGAQAGDAWEGPGELAEEGRDSGSRNAETGTAGEVRDYPASWDEPVQSSPKAPGSQPSHDDITSLIKDLGKNKVEGQITIPQLRAEVAKKFGAHAASHEVLDKMLKDMRWDRKIRLIAIGDPEAWQHEGAYEGTIPGEGETFGYVAPYADPLGETSPQSDSKPPESKPAPSSEHRTAPPKRTRGPDKKHPPKGPYAQQIAAHLGQQPDEPIEDASKRLAADAAQGIANPPPPKTYAQQIAEQVGMKPGESLADASKRVESESSSPAPAPATNEPPAQASTRTVPRGLKGTLLGKLHSAPDGLTLEQVKTALGENGEHAAEAVKQLEADGRLQRNGDRFKVKGAASPKPPPAAYPGSTRKRPSEAAKPAEQLVPTAPAPTPTPPPAKAPPPAPLATPKPVPGSYHEQIANSFPPEHHQAMEQLGNALDPTGELSKPSPPSPLPLSGEGRGAKGEGPYTQQISQQNRDDLGRRTGGEGLNYSTAAKAFARQDPDVLAAQAELRAAKPEQQEAAKANVKRAYDAAIAKHNQMFPSTATVDTNAKPLTRRDFYSESNNRPPEELTPRPKPTSAPKTYAEQIAEKMRGGAPFPKQPQGTPQPPALAAGPSKDLAAAVNAKVGSQLAEAGHAAAAKRTAEARPYEKIPHANPEEHKRTFAALVQNGFARNQYPLRRGGQVIPKGHGWVRKGPRGWETFSDDEAVAKLNEGRLPNPMAARLDRIDPENKPVSYADQIRARRGQ